MCNKHVHSTVTTVECTDPEILAVQSLVSFSM